VVRPVDCLKFKNVQPGKFSERIIGGSLYFSLETGKEQLV